MPNTLLEAPASTLGTTQGPLALRIRGTERDGQTVRLHSSKIAIGSGENCTLRLRAAAVAPLHCLILRGSKRTVVRRWNLDTRINGSSFEDSPLNPGDRLAIGPIEFEVLPTENAEPAVAAEEVGPSRDALTNEITLCQEREQIAREKQALEKSCAELNAKLAQFDAERTEWQKSHTDGSHDLHRQRTELDQQAQQLTARLATLETEREAFESQNKAFGDRSKELDDRRSALVQEQQAWQQTKESQQNELNGKHRQLEQKSTELDAQAAKISARDAEIAAREAELANRPIAAMEVPQTDPQIEQAKAELEASRKEFESAQAAWKTEQERQNAELAERQTKIEQAEKDFASQQESLKADQAKLAASQADLDKQRQEAQAEKDRLATEQSQAAAELEAQKQTLEQDRESWVKSTAEKTAELEQRSAQLNAGKEQLEAAKKQFADERSQWTADRDQHTALQEQLSSQNSQLTADRDELATQRQQLTSDREQLTTDRAQLTAEKARLTSERERLTADHDQLNGAREQLAAERQKFEQEIALAQTTREQLPATEASNGFSPEPINDESEQPEAVEQSAESSADASSEANQDDVFARLRALSLLKADSAEPSAPAQPEPVAEAPAAPGRRKSDAGDPEVDTGTRRKDDPLPEGGDESIDDYMARLLQRMRGISGEPAASKPSAPTASRIAPTPSPETRTAEEHTDSSAPKPKQRPFTLEAPRNAAPERSRDLAAMREIANLTARSAIAAHQHRRGTNRAWGSLAVGVVGLACAIFLFCTAPDLQSPFFYGGLVALVASGISLIKSGFLAQNVRQSRDRRKQQFEVIAKEQAKAEAQASMEQAHAAPAKESPADENAAHSG